MFSPHSLLKQREQHPIRFPKNEQYGKIVGGKVSRLDRENVTIHLKTIILSLVVVFILETGAKVVVFAGLQNTIMLLGAVRLLEAASLVLLVMATEKGLSPIGLKKGKILDGIRRGIIWSACFGIVAAFGLVLFQAMGIRLLEKVRIPMPPDFDAVFFIFLVGGLIGPIAEELFFRGIVYGFFRRWGKVTAILSSAFLFVIAHPALPAIPVIPITGGLLFAVAYEMEGNLMVPLSIHILGNMAIYTISFQFC